MRISKRELFAYVLLYKTLGSREVAIGEFFDVLSSRICLSTASAMRMMRRLRKLGLIGTRDERGTRYVYMKDLIEALLPLAEAYTINRCERRKEGRGRPLDKRV